MQCIILFIMATKAENTGLTCKRGYYLFKDGEKGKVTIGRIGVSRRDAIIDGDSRVTVRYRFFFQKEGYEEQRVRISEIGDKIQVDSPCGIDCLIAGFGCGVLGGHLEISRVKG